MKVSTQRFKLKRLVLITGLVFGMAACGNDDLAPPPSPPAANNAPVISSTALTAADEGQAYTYTFTATDADADALTLAATTIPAWLAFDVGTGVLSGTPGSTDVGNHDVTLTVTDGTDTATESFTIVVTEASPQVAPTFTSTALVTGKVGTSYSYTATASDANFDTLEFSAVTVPAWAVFDAPSATLSGTPDMVGDYAVELMVSDGTDEATQAFTIAIAPSDVVTVELTVFENVALPEWAAWTDNGGPTEVVTDDVEHDQVTQFTLTKPSVAGFSGRASETDSGMPFDASGLISNGSITFELKLITAPIAGTVPWYLKVEGTGASEVLLSSSVEGHASPMLDTWQTYTFPLSTFVAAGNLDASTINLFMVFPSYNDANGAVYYLDNFQIISAEGGATNDSELIANGDFENGLASWKPDVGSVVADGTNNIFEADVQAAGNAYDVNQSQVIPITEGATYTMSFKAKASVARTMIAGLGQNAAPFNSVTDTPALTTEWQTFTYDLVADGIGGETSRVLFDMGAEVGIVNIDDVSVQLKVGDTVVVVEPGPETLTNGDFESGLDSWKADVGSVVADGANSIFEADVQAAGNAYDVNQSQIIPITEGATYTMSFKAKASVARTMIAGLGQNAAPFNSVTETPALTTEWQTFTYDLVANGIGGETSRVLFDMGAEVGIVNIDDVSVKLTDGSTAGGGGETPIQNTEMGFDFEAGGNVGTWSVFENDSNPALEFIPNPDATGANTSATVAKFTALQAGQRYAGTETKSGPVFTLDASNSTVRIMVWKSVISPVGIKFANANGGAQVEVLVANQTVNAWEEIVFDLSGNVGLGDTSDLTTVIVFPDFDAVGSERTQDNVIYFDNITFSAQ